MRFRTEMRCCWCRRSPAGLDVVRSSRVPRHVKAAEDRVEPALCLHGRARHPGCPPDCSSPPAVTPQFGQDDHVLLGWTGQQVDLPIIDIRVACLSAPATHWALLGTLAEATIAHPPSGVFFGLFELCGAVLRRVASHD